MDYRGLESLKAIIKNAFRERFEKLELTLPKNRYFMENTISLNVGCGATNKYPFKDFNCYINCDLSIPEMKIKNYIRCEAMTLPFRPIFNYLIASHIVEHLPDPDAAIEEFKKISNFIIIVVPSSLSTGAYHDPTHKWVRFDGKWLKIPKILRIIVQPRLIRYILGFILFLLGIPNNNIIEMRGNVFDP